MVVFWPRIAEFCPQIQVKTKKRSSQQIGTDFGRNFGSPWLCKLIFSNLNFASDRKHVFTLSYAVQRAAERSTVRGFEAVCTAAQHRGNIACSVEYNSFELPVFRYWDKFWFMFSFLRSFVNLNSTAELHELDVASGTVCRTAHSQCTLLEHWSALLILSLILTMSVLVDSKDSLGIAPVNKIRCSINRNEMFVYSVLFSFNVCVCVLQLIDTVVEKKVKDWTSQHSSNQAAVL